MSTEITKQQEIDIESKYQIKDEIDHILDRSGMYIGSSAADIIEYNLYKPSDNKIVKVPNVPYYAGLIKLIDEVLTNSVDEYRRGLVGKALFKISEIKVFVGTDGTVIIEDNGGIPVKRHSQTGLYVPEMIFGHLRTSSNYNDNEERTVIGTNGLGAKLTNVFSKEFIVETSDGKNSCYIKWNNNMKNVDKPIINSSNKHFTKTTFKFDLDRFELTEIPMAVIRIIQKKCIDACGANIGLVINFESDIAEGKLNSNWQFNNFKEYVSLYLSDDQLKNTLDYTSSSGKDNIILVPSIGFNFGFVNGGECSKGTHIKKLSLQITKKILEICKDKEMELITEKDILNRISIFVSTTIYNPTYNSQTKEELTNRIDVNRLNFSKEFLESLKDSEIFKQLEDYYNVKYAAEKKKELRKLNAAIKNTKTDKLIKCSSSKKEENELWIFEGTSASNGFRSKANPQHQAAYLLRGKILNAFNLNRAQILENRELREIVAICQLQFESPKQNLKSIPFSKLIIASDADVDGSHIAGLILSFILKHFPEIIKAGMLYRSLSPIVIVTMKDKTKKYYYTQEEFEQDFKDDKIKNYLDINYCKGLGSLEDDDYSIMLHQQKLVRFKYEDIGDFQSTEIWFSKSTEQRKELMMMDSLGDETDEF